MAFIHISHMSRKFIKHPSQVVSVEICNGLGQENDTERESQSVTLAPVKRRTKTNHIRRA